MANTYRGELLELMTIHCILLAANKVDQDLKGQMEIYLDCLGTLKKVVLLPVTQLPTSCKHSDILKNIMVNCRDLTFNHTYTHIKAH